MKEQVRILFLGDMMLGENVYHLGRGIRSKYGNDFPNMIPETIKTALMKEIDAVIYNFEYSLAPDGFDFKDFEQSIYASTLASLEVLPKDVIRIVNIANNHFWERGPEMTAFTISSLKKNGFVVIGESKAPITITIKGRRIVMWGCSLLDWDVPVFTSTYDNLLNDLEMPSVKEEDSIWLMSIHWGTEFITYPDKEQMDLAHRLIDCGFDIVHGHHPHVFQPVENYKDGFIMYSMGNFLFDENFAKNTQLSYCLKVELSYSFPHECYLIKNRNYRPYCIKKQPNNEIDLKPNGFWSYRRKIIIKQLYNTLRKLEYLPHIMDNNFYIYKSLKQRSNK